MKSNTGFDLYSEVNRYTNLLKEFSDIFRKYYTEYATTKSPGVLLQNPAFNVLMEHSPGVMAILNFPDRSFLYISPNVQKVLGGSPTAFTTNGLAESLKFFTPEHQEILVKQIFPTLMNHFAQYAMLGTAKDLRFTYTTLLKSADNTYRWYLHQITVFEVDEGGFPVVGIKYINDIHSIKTDHKVYFTIEISNANGHYTTIYNKVLSHNQPILSPRELEMVKYIEQGFSAKEIADKMFISENTVFNHRKNIFKKMGVKSSLELVHIIHQQG